MFHCHFSASRVITYLPAEAVFVTIAHILILNATFLKYQTQTIRQDPIYF